MGWIGRHIAIILILCVGFILRFSISIIHSYSNDELSAVSRLRYSNFDDLINLGVKTGDMHPAGVQVFMKAWSSLVGTSEMGMRFPFVLFGILSLFMIYLIGRQWFNERVGLFASGLMAVLYFPIMNSEFARPYSPGLLISLLVGYFLYKVLFEDKAQWRNAIVLGVLFAAGMYTHYFAFLFVGFMGATGLFYLNKRNWFYLLLAGALGVLLFLPHLEVTLYHLSVGGLQWLPAPGSFWLFEFLFHAFNESWLVLGLLFLFTIYALLKVKKWEPVSSRNTRLVALWFFGIFSLGFILSYLSTPVLKFPVMLFALPYFMLLLGVIIARIKQFYAALAILMLVVTGSTLAERDLFGNQHYALFRETGIKMAEWNALYGEENIYTVYNINNTNYINFYAEEWGGDSIHFDWWNIEFDGDIQLRRDLMEREEAYCIIGFSSRLTLEQVFETVREFYPVVVDYQPCNNGNLFLMRKGIEEVPFVKKELVATFEEANLKNWVTEPSQMKAISGQKLYYALDSVHIFGPTYNFSVADLPKIEHAYLRVEVEAELDTNAALVVSLSGDRAGEAIQHRGENMWIGHHLEEMILNSAEGTGYFAFKIPDYVRETDVLKIGLWNVGSTSVLVKGFRIYYVENKWN